MSVICNTFFHASNFSWNPNTRTFTAEISDLGRNVNSLSRLYDDACDEGFWFQSQKNQGCKELFYLDQTDTDSDGEDVYGWHFKPVNKALDFTVLIIND